MAYHLEPFEGKTLRAFHLPRGENTFLVTTFEDHMPSEFDWVSLEHQPFPLPSSARNRDGYEYHAFLPKDPEAIFNCHLFSCLRETRVVTSDGRVHLDDVTKKAWGSLEKNMTVTISCLLRGALVTLEDSEPPLAEKYGYTRSHKSIRSLNYCLKICRHAFLLRFAYLMYIRTIRSPSVDPLPSWVRDVIQGSHAAWVDSLWEAVRRQCLKRNFIGTLIEPHAQTVRWIKAATEAGVPIWVLWHKGSRDYEKVEGGHVTKMWHATAEAMAAATLPSIPPPINPPPLLPTPSTTTLPPGSMFITDWQEFFRKLNEDDQLAESVATLSEKQQWENRQRAAAGYHQPGAKGPRVFTWREESGGYIREQVDRKDVGAVWEGYLRREMVFNARSNMWDLCPMISGRCAGGDDRDLEVLDDRDLEELDELDAAEDALGELQDRWFLEPTVPAPPPNTDLTELGFLFRRYGFSSIEPYAVQDDPPMWDNNETMRRIPGLQSTGENKHLDHLPVFISAILQGRLPRGHCDLSEDSPDNERFPFSTWGLIDQVERVQVPSLSDAPLFMFEPRDGRVKVLVHDILTVAEMGRVGLEIKLKSVIDYLLRNGSRFTVLASHPQYIDPNNTYPLSLSIRLPGWVADVTDYHLYMSRLKVFLTDRPYVAAAALARGGIAWRITREVLGLDIDLILNDTAFTGQAMAIEAVGSTWWCHAVDVREWFYLVGGYSVLTGTSFV